MKLREILKGAKPFDPDAFEPLEGAEDLHLDRSAGLEAQLKQMTAMWTARGEDIEYLASELREAQYAFREIAAKVARSTSMPYRSQSSVLRQVGAMADAAAENLENGEHGPQALT